MDAFYRAQGFKCNSWIATSLDPPMDRSRPDCRHHGPGLFEGEVYEIKSFQEAVLGSREVWEYIWTLASRYPSIKWHPGMYLLAPPVFKLPEFPFMSFYLEIPLPGVITYHAIPDYGEAVRVGLTMAAVTMLAMLLNMGFKADIILGRPIPIPAPA